MKYVTCHNDTNQPPPNYPATFNVIELPPNINVAIDFIVANQDRSPRYNTFSNYLK